MEVYREEIGASGDAVAAVIGHDGEDRWKCWGKVAGIWWSGAGWVLLVWLMVLGWCGLVLLDGRVGEKNDGYQGIPILRFIVIRRVGLNIIEGAILCNRRHCSSRARDAKCVALLASHEVGADTHICLGGSE